MDNIFDLKNFDSYCEDNRLEVKNANGGLPGSLWETYSSFANTYGGCIICGVVEKKDKIVMANPGTIICGKKQMLKGGISQPRNKGLFKMFNLIGLGEHAGSGVPDIFKAWKDEGLKKPEVEEQFGGRVDGRPDRTILTLPLVAKDGNSDTIQHSSIDADISIDLLTKILDYCKEPRSRAELQELCGIKSPYHFREKILNPLLKGGQLVRTIPDKPNSSKQKYIRKTSL